MKLLNTNISVKNIFIPLVILLALTLISCENPAASDHEHHHHEEHAVGAAFLMNGKKIAEYHNDHIHGEIAVRAGGETALITIKFIAEDGDLFQPHEPGHFLGWKVTDTSLAKIEQHADDGKWNFHIIGKKGGTTTVAFKLMHGAEEAAHSHFNTMPIPIIINK